MMVQQEGTTYEERMVQMLMMQFAMLPKHIGHLIMDFGIFSNCKNFNGDVSGWDVHNVTDMSYMFCYCQNFKGDVSGWDVRNVTNMYCMFNGCENFEGNVSGWDV